jgi:hypothetical protein
LSTCSCKPWMDLSAASTAASYPAAWSSKSPLPAALPKHGAHVEENLAEWWPAGP